MTPLPTIPLQIAFAADCARRDQRTGGCSLHGVCGESSKPRLTGCPDYMRGKFEQGVEHPPVDVANPVQVRTTSAGIGDALMTLAVGCGLQARWPATTLVVVCSPHLRPWLELFDGFHVSKEPLRGPMFFCEHNVGTPSFREFRRRGLARWEYWAEQFGARPALPPVKALPPAAVARAMPLSGRILLAPFAAYAERTWPLEKWLEVEKSLLAMGFRCVILAAGPRGTERFQSEKWIAQRASHVAALMQTSLCLLGNDSGMAHLAGILRLPAVAICAAASDRNIMGLWPSVQSLGGKAGLESVSVENAVQAVLTKVNAGLGEFPTAAFSSVILERDRWRLPCWNTVYAALWRAVRELQPKSIVEIGTRAGYSAWVMSQAAPSASIIGIDADFDGDEAVTHGGFHGACSHAKEIMRGYAFELRISNSQELERLPECELCFVDGDHSRDGAFSDLRLAERSGIKTILVDDYTNFCPVRTAVAEFLARYPGWNFRFIPSDTGLALLTKGNS